MRSSTSSSNDRAPQGRWGRIWLYAVLILLVSFGAVEVGFRARGMTPRYQDTPRYWAYWRAQLDDAGEAGVALIGSSRTQLGIDPEVLNEAIPERLFVQLAMIGATPLPVLEHLAEDETFRGSVVLEGYPRHLFQRADERVARTWIDYYARRSWIDDLETRLRAALQSRAVVARPEFRPTLFLVTLLQRGELPSETYAKMRFSRWTAADYARKRIPDPPWSMDLSATLDEEGLQRRFATIRRHVEAIEARGGRVVVVRMPTSGDIADYERRHFPRVDYWDRFVRETGVDAIHFEDHPSLCGHHQPDGHHLDARSVPAFSGALAELLVERGFVR